MCSGQDSAGEARKGQRGGEPHPADGAERTDHREGLILCLSKCSVYCMWQEDLIGVVTAGLQQPILKGPNSWCGRKRCNLFYPTKLVASKLEITKSLQSAPAYAGSSRRASSSLLQSYQSGILCGVAAGLRGAPDWSVRADWAASCKQRPDESHNTTAEDCLG